MSYRNQHNVKHLQQSLYIPSSIHHACCLLPHHSESIGELVSICALTKVSTLVPTLFVIIVILWSPHAKTNKCQHVSRENGHEFWRQIPGLNRRECSITGKNPREHLQANHKHGVIQPLLAHQQSLPRGAARPVGIFPDGALTSIGSSRNVRRSQGAFRKSFIMLIQKIFNLLQGRKCVVCCSIWFKEGSFCANIYIYIYAHANLRREGTKASLGKKTSVWLVVMG